MDQENTKQAIAICSEAYTALEEAKEDCQHMVESAIDALFGITEETGKKMSKEIKAQNKDDIKAVKKIAKAVAQSKINDVAAESSTLSEMIDRLGMTA